MKRKIVIFTVVLMVVQALTLHASSLGTIPFWESDSSSIGRWNNTPKIYLSGIGTGTFTETNFNSYITYARNQWKDAGISTTTTSSATSADITYYGGTWSQISSLFVSIPLGALGYAQYDTTYEGDWTHSTGPKTGYLLNESNVYIVFESGKSTNHYRHVSTHELGHALGWFGHASGSFNIMSPGSSNTILDLTTIDKRHLAPIY